MNGIYASCVEENALGQRSFPRIYMRRDADISKFLKPSLTGKIGHKWRMTYFEESNAKD